METTNSHWNNVNSAHHETKRENPRKYADNFVSRWHHPCKHMSHSSIHTGMHRFSSNHQYLVWRLPWSYFSKEDLNECHFGLFHKLNQIHVKADPPKYAKILNCMAKNNLPDWFHLLSQNHLHPNLVLGSLHYWKFVANYYSKIKNLTPSRFE